jgi:hypothetical protein
VLCDGFNAGQKQQDEEIKKLRDIAAKNNKPDHDLKDYAGTYSNTVYGKIEVRAEKDKLNIYFSHHPGLVGRLEPLGVDEFLCTYSDPTYGVKKIPFHATAGQVRSVTVTVNDFIDFMEYEFVKQ